jgi:hypothetical protein
LCIHRFLPEPKWFVKANMSVLLGAFHQVFAGAKQIKARYWWLKAPVLRAKTFAQLLTGVV